MNCTITDSEYVKYIHVIQHRFLNPRPGLHVHCLCTMKVHNGSRNINSSRKSPALRPEKDAIGQMLFLQSPLALSSDKIHCCIVSHQILRNASLPASKILSSPHINNVVPLAT